MMLGLKKQHVDRLINLRLVHVWSSKLETAALRHSKDVMDNDFFSHTSSHADTFLTRIDDVGYIYSNAGENIAMGYPSEENVMNE